MDAATCSAIIGCVSAGRFVISRTDWEAELHSSRVLGSFVVWQVESGCRGAHRLAISTSIKMGDAVLGAVKKVIFGWELDLPAERHRDCFGVLDGERPRFAGELERARAGSLERIKSCSLIASLRAALNSGASALASEVMYDIDLENAVL